MGLARAPAGNSTSPTTVRPSVCESGVADQESAMAAPIAPVGYLAPDGFLPELQKELGAAASATHGRLVLARAPLQPVAWAANVWCEPEEIPISSIGDAAKKLRAIQRNWVLYPHAHYRRA